MTTSTPSENSTYEHRLCTWPLGDNEVWVIRYHALGPVAGLLCKWAQSVLELHPDERKVEDETELSIAARSLQEIEYGNANPRIYTLYKIAKRCDVSLQDLLVGAEIPLRDLPPRARKQ